MLSASLIGFHAFGVVSLGTIRWVKLLVDLGFKTDFMAVKHL